MPLSKTRALEIKHSLKLVLQLAGLQDCREPREGLAVLFSGKVYTVCEALGSICSLEDLVWWHTCKLSTWAVKEENQEPRLRYIVRPGQL